ncbi:MAG: DUF1573 domain-containing protein [Thermodesulfobacteriota bacterium]|nr:DUF1573 domain-containing protein [Thermodesulfobacteriota bacterium]
MRVKAPGGLKTTIGPGESKKITAIIDTRYRRGKLNKDIRVITNDPDAKTLRLSIQANIVQDLYTQPFPIDFGEVKHGSSYEKEIVITNKGKKPISITEIKISQTKALTISPSDKFTLAPGQTRKFVLTLVPGLKEGKFRGSVIMMTDIEYLPRKIIFVRARVVGDND